MAKYRKKPVMIEAFQLGVGDFAPDWFMDALRQGTITKYGDDTRSPFDISPDPTIYCDIETLEGTHRANSGDYIIQGVNGELYPCKPDIFEKTYEFMDD